MELKLTTAQYMIYTYSIIIQEMNNRYNFQKSDEQLLVDGYKYRVSCVERIGHYTKYQREQAQEILDKITKPIYVQVDIELYDKILGGLYKFLSYCNSEFDKYIIEDCQTIINKMERLKV